jgi:class 3 adenylate cyclase/tetratricopeptide (TPR) repeat protein/ribosomal protein L40E
MRCSKCGTNNPSTDNFCAKCGNALAKQCAKCKAENPPTSDFCGKCGAPLANGAGVAAATSPPSGSASGVRIAPEQPDASPAIEGERKTVTALFADIKGSTELEQDLDPEEARAIVDPALKLMIDAVRRYDGYVVQSTGDGIFALFGAPVAHEDHPQRALYAALRMQEELRRYGAKLQADGRAPIEIRVGVNTGEVVVRSITTGAAQVEYTPIGHTTNLASRLQSIARTGSIVASEATRKFCEGYFILKPLGATKVKGVSEPVGVYEVTGLGPLRTRLQRSAGRGLTKFVGRQREMDAMKAAAEQAKAGHGQIVAAMAEAGVGKSRLYYEFKATSQSGWMVLETFSVSHGKASAYLPVIDLLRNYFKLTSEDDERARREKVGGKVLMLDRSLEDTLPYLFALLDIVEGADPLAQMDARVRKRRTLEITKRLLLRESLNQPLMVIFEDLHWIDEETQALLNSLADSLGTSRVLMLVNYRPEYSHSWGSKTYYTQLRLDPLGKESAQEMLTSLLGNEAELDELKRLTIEKTEGNPFFMEETVLVLFDEGALVRNGTIKLTRPLSELKIPPTVQAILTARIDRLPPDEKDLLQTLAVLGKEFSLGLVKGVTARSDQELERMLADLQLGEFVYEQPAFPDPEYVFKHALTQEVSYNSILTERRKALHERVGASIESMFADRLDDYLVDLAHHYGRSGNTRKAAEYLRRSAEQALHRSAYQESIASLTRGLELLQRLPDDSGRASEELKLQTILVECLAAVQGPSSPDARAAMERALELAEKLQNKAEIFRALTALHPSYLITLELEKVRKLADRSLALAEEEGDPHMLASSHGEIGNILIYKGAFAAAKPHLEKALAPANAGGSWPGFFGSFPPPLALALLGWNAWMLGYPEQARKHVALSLDVAKEQPGQFLRAVGVMWNLRVYTCLRDGQTLATARSLSELAADRGFLALAPLASMFHGWALAAQGHATEGVAELESIFSELLAISRIPTFFRILFADAYGQAGRPGDGLRHVTDSLRISDETGERAARAELHRLHGELLLLQDATRIDEAERAFRIAIEVAREQSSKSWELRASTSLAQLLDRQGHRDEARAMLADIYNWFTEGFDTPDLKDAKALLEELSG